MTSFQKKVYEIVKRIPMGKVLSYKEVAKLSGHHKAYQAVGNILNKNRNLYQPKFSKKTLVGKIPCHRVIRLDGKVGGYRTGQKIKIALLKKEGLIIKNKKIVP